MHVEPIYEEFYTDTFKTCKDGLLNCINCCRHFYLSISFFYVFCFVLFFYFKEDTFSTILFEYKSDLNFWDCFRKEKKSHITEEIQYDTTVNS